MRRFALPLLAGLAAAPVVAQPSPLPEAPTWAREIAVTGLDSAFALARDGQGRIVVAGSAALNVAFARLHPEDGRLDSTFGTNGIVQLQPDPANRSVLRTLAVEADGKIVAAGTTGATGRGDVLMVRLLADGRRDASFGTNGIVRRDVSGDDRVRALLLGDNLSLLIAGSNENVTFGGTGDLRGRSAFVMRLNSSGGLTGFGRNGIAYLTPGEASTASSLTAANNGALIVGALRQIGADVSAVLLQLDQNGSEMLFADGSAQRIVSSPASDGPVGIASLPDNVLATASWSRTDVRQTLLDANRAAVSTRTDNLGGNDRPRSLTADAQVGIVVVGQSESQAFLLRQPIGANAPNWAPDGLGTSPQIGRYAIGGRPTGFESLVLDGRRAYVAGWTAGTAGRTSLLVAAFDLPAIVAGEDAPAPEAFTLDVSPLPARGVATVRVASAARLTLVDALGRTVRALDVAAGTHPLDVSGLAVGLYVLRADAEGQAATRLLPVVR